jgi:hypothetical protein
MTEITSKEQLINEIAEALNNGSYDLDSFWYISITKQVVEYHINPDFPVDIYYPDDGEEIVRIDPLPSREGFEIMELFAEAHPGRHQDYLYRALNRRHPFSSFRVAVENSGLLQQWYDWKDKAMKIEACRWMRFHDVDFKDGRIVAGDTEIWKREDVKDEEEI